MRGRIFWQIVLIVLAIMGGSELASARHRHHAGEAVSGEFDYYLLSLSWSPAYCLQSPGAGECSGTRKYGFIVHGLWPQNERGWPENCAAGGQVPDSVVQDMLPVMPARGLIYHEWSTHGTCSGLDPAAFFELTKRAYRSVAIPAPFSGSTAVIEQPPGAVAAAFLRANPNLPRDSVVATCSGQDTPRLREVHVCFSRDLVARACSADVLRGACRAASVIIPPIR